MNYYENKLLSEMKYKILNHTADLRLEIYGKTLGELFMNAVEALADILGGKSYSRTGETDRESFKEFIRLRSSNITQLLVDFLNEILAKSNIHKRVYKVHKVIKLKDAEIEAEIIGVPAEKFEEDIKAVTYHEVDIKKEGGLWQTKLVMDI